MNRREVIHLIILEDMNNKPGKHETKHRIWEYNGIEIVRQRLPVGDYVLINDKMQDVFNRKEKRGIPVKMMDLLGTYGIAVDSKKDIQELVGDVCGKAHDRFRDECILAMNNGIKLYIVVENEDGITDLSELHRWVNPRLWIRRGGKQLYPTATRGVTLMKCCFTMQKKYSPLEFVFCAPGASPMVILDLLRGGEK